MDILLTRFEKTEKHSIGRLEIPNVFSCFTCEDAQRAAKIKGETAIPTGKYEIIINWSPRFRRRLPILLEVPNYEGIRIHAGNTPEDTEGCILCGLVNNNDGTIGYSTRATDTIIDLIQNALKKGEKVFIEIK